MGDEDVVAVFLARMRMELLKDDIVQRKRIEIASMLATAQAAELPAPIVFGAPRNGGVDTLQSCCTKRSRKRGENVVFRREVQVNSPSRPRPP